MRLHKYINYYILQTSEVCHSANGLTGLWVEKKLESRNKTKQVLYFNLC